jgi:hypothetical protein
MDRLINMITALLNLMVSHTEVSLMCGISFGSFEVKLKKGQENPTHQNSSSSEIILESV